MERCNMEESMLGEETETLANLLYKMNRNTNGIIFILNADGCFEGVITDGDIKRAMMRGHSLSEPAKDFVNKNPSVVLENDSQPNIEKKFDSKIRVLPIIDKKGDILGYYRNTDMMPIANPQLNGNELNYLLDAFVSTWISSNGYYINRFEEDFPKYCGCHFGVATSNGTCALHLALEALNVKEGDEIILPDLTFAATINAVLYTGATPVIVDIEEDGWCIDPKAIESAITERTKVIIPVHLYGQPCNMDAICKIAKEHNIYIVEDCAEAHGAMYKGKKVGTFGEIGCFSFFGNKVITTGEGGMCITDSKELTKIMRKLRDHGMSKEHKYYHDVIGYNYRMTNLQAAVGVGQLERIDTTLNWRKKLEKRYNNALAECNHVTLQRTDLKDREKIAWLVSVLVEADRRDELIDEMKRRGIESRPFFVPLSEMEIYKKFAKKCEISRVIAAKGINLPTNYRVSDETIRQIVEVLQ